MVFVTHGDVYYGIVCAANVMPVFAATTIALFLEQMVMATISRNSYPLFISLLVKNAVTWTSETIPTSNHLTENASKTFENMLSELESRLGVIFVSHALSYITVADGGLSEVCIAALYRYRCYHRARCTLA